MSRIHNIRASQVFAREIVSPRINMNGWIIEAGSDGLYVTTPSGIRTKVELIDFRETPIPETPPLNLPPTGAAPSTQVPGGPPGPGLDSTINT